MGAVNYSDRPVADLYSESVLLGRTDPTQPTNLCLGVELYKWVARLTYEKGDAWVSRRTMGLNIPVFRGLWMHTFQWRQVFEENRLVYRLEYGLGLDGFDERISQDVTEEISRWERSSA